MKVKIKFEIWFLLIPLLIALATYFVLSVVINAIPYSSEPRSFTKISEEDFSLLPKLHKSNLDGMNLQREVVIDRPIAVVIENYSMIRNDQEGLEEAAIVYETLTEGGITRLLAIYNGDPVDLIGPIRSARSYFVDWAKEYKAVFLHVGGSPVSLENLKISDRVLDINEFAGGDIIWRHSKKPAPHNAYTSISNVYKAIRANEFENAMEELRFPFKMAREKPGEIEVITIDFSTDPYLVKYAFDSKDHLYSRHNGGEKHGNIKAANVIIQYTDQEVVDNEGRIRIQTKGTGKAFIFRDGKAIEATWQKDASVNDPNQPLKATFTRFFDYQGNEIELNKGQTWIEVVSHDTVVNYF